MILKFVKQIVSALKGIPEMKAQATAAVDNKLLIQAVHTNDTDLVNALLKEGADPNALGPVGAPQTGK